MKNLKILKREPFNFNILLPGSILIIFLLASVSVFAQKPTIERDNGAIKVQTLAEDLEHPWAIAFLPDDRLLLTERPGRLRIVDTANNVSESIQGVPDVFAKDRVVYRMLLLILISQITVMFI